MCVLLTWRALRRPLLETRLSGIRIRVMPCPVSATDIVVRSVGSVGKGEARWRLLAVLAERGAVRRRVGHLCRRRVAIAISIGVPRGTRGGWSVATAAALETRAFALRAGLRRYLGSSHQLLALLVPVRQLLVGLCLCVHHVASPAVRVPAPATNAYLYWYGYVISDASESVWLWLWAIFDKKTTSTGVGVLCTSAHESVRGHVVNSERRGSGERATADTRRARVHHVAAESRRESIRSGRAYRLAKERQLANTRCCPRVNSV